MTINRSALMRGCFLTLVAFGLGSGCASGRLVLHSDSRAPLANDRRPAESGNGGPRGGGDPVAGEFMEYERIVLAKMEAWRKQGKLPITDEEIEKVRALMPPNEQTNPKHIVTSEPHACITEGKKPNGECLDPRDERDVVKQPFAKPPRLIVGQVRWADLSNTPAKKEITTQHELWGLALSKKGENFADEDFSKTYDLLMSSTKEWNSLVRQHFDFMQKIRLYDEMKEIVDLAHFQTATGTFIKSSTDYSRCVNASDAEVDEISKIEVKMAKKINRKSKSDGLFENLRKIEEATSELNNTDVKKACDRAIETYYVVLILDAVPQVNDQMRKIDEMILAVINEYQNWANSIGNSAWRNWLFKKMQLYIDRRREVMDRSYAHQPTQFEISRVLNPIMDEHCPRSANKDFRDAARCNIEAGVPVANAYFKSFLSKAVDGLIRAHNDSVSECASQVDPI